MTVELKQTWLVLCNPILTSFSSENNVFSAFPTPNQNKYRIRTLHYNYSCHEASIVWKIKSPLFLPTYLPYFFQTVTGNKHRVQHNCLPRCKWIRQKTAIGQAELDPDLPCSQVFYGQSLLFEVSSENYVGACTYPISFQTVTGNKHLFLPYLRFSCSERMVVTFLSDNGAVMNLAAAGFSVKDPSRYVRMVTLYTLAYPPDASGLAKSRSRILS